jgi:twitching motility protein PilT
MHQMPGIELSEMTEDLVFDDRPVVKPKPQSAQPPVTGVAKKPDSAEPLVSAKINPPEVELSLDLASEPAAKVNRSPTPAQVSPPPTQVARPIVQPTPPPVHAAPPPVQGDSRSFGEPVVSGGLLLNERRKVRQDVTSAQKKEALDLFETLIASAAKGGASDLLLKRGQVPMFRWNGELFPSRNGPRLESAFLETLASVLLSKAHCERLNEVNDVDLSFQSQRGGRTRVNIFSQCGELGLVARLIPSEIPTFEKLEMDATLKRLVDQKRGLVLVTGATGSGKSTTLAALLDYINSTRTAHIITIEDPIEFIHHDKRSMFNQRELGLDTRGYAEALRSALRQAPDVILVGELRDSETMEVALQAAETGHLVLSTLHTNDAADSILRILGLTGQEKEAIVRQQLADTLRGVISQRLVKRADKSGRVAAQEVMINTATIRERLLKGAHPSIVRDFIAQGSNQGMRTFDQHLIQLVKAGIVEYDEALKNASNRDDFTLRFSGVSDGREAS